MAAPKTRPIGWPIVALLGLPAAAQFSCSARSEARIGQQQVMLTEADDGGWATLGADGVLTLELEARPAAGYCWNVDQLDTSVLRLAENEHVGSGRVGGTDAQVLRFLGVRDGRTTLVVAYRRPWETDRPARIKLTYDVIVEGAFRGVFAPAQAPEVELAAAPAGYGASPTDSHYDVCEVYGCTPIKDQGYCNDCWAFATAGLLEQRILATDGVTRDLSEQYLLSCNNDGWNCDTGWPAFDYYLDKYVSGETAAGAVYEEDFPYAEQQVSCTGKPHTHHERIASYKQLRQGLTVPTVDELKTAIATYGGIWAGVCSDSAFDSYRSGIFDRTTCSPGNHAVVLTGWDDNGGDGTTGGYWYLRNSWGTEWGEQGNMRIGWGVNAIGETGTYVVYEASSGGTGGTGGTNTGGAETGGATGGTDTGGTASGGTGVGGTSSGGANTGGTPADGSATGGANTGGDASGGASTGGTSTGGASTGGTSTGGTSTGGTTAGGATSSSSGATNSGGALLGGAGSGGAATSGSASVSGGVGTGGAAGGGASGGNGTGASAAAAAAAGVTPASGAQTGSGAPSGGQTAGTSEVSENGCGCRAAGAVSDSSTRRDAWLALALSALLGRRRFDRRWQRRGCDVNLDCAENPGGAASRDTAPTAWRIDARLE